MKPIKTKKINKTAKKNNPKQEKSQGQFLKLSQKLAQLQEEVKRLSKQLKSCLQKNETILHSIGEGLLIIDRRGRLLEINPMAEAILGLKKKQFLGRLIKKQLAFYPELHQVLLNQKKNHQIAKIEIQIKPPTSKKKEVYSVLIAPLYEAKKRMIGHIATFRDITHEKELEQAKDEFLSIASHELRTPMTAIKGYLSMLLEGDAGPLPQQAKDFLNEIYIANERLVKLVEDILNVSRLESERLQINPRFIDLDQIIQTILNQLKPLAEEKGLALIYEKPKNLPPVYADPDRVTQILENLIDNAIKFTPQGSIRIFLQPQQGMVVVSVIDTGIGIAPADQEQLFKKFFRADNAITQKSPGSGLGLYIAKELAKRMDGDLWVESELGKGSSFSFSLPLLKPSR